MKNNTTLPTLNTKLFCEVLSAFLARLDLHGDESLLFVALCEPDKLIDGLIEQAEILKDDELRVSCGIQASEEDLNSFIKCLSDFEITV